MDVVEEKPTGSAEGGDGSADSNKPDDSSAKSADKSKAKVVPWDVYERSREDGTKAKNRIRELEAEVDAQKTRGLQEKEDFKGLYEREKQARTADKEELANWKKWTVKTQRFNAVQSEAVKAGLLPSAVNDLELLNLEDVQVEVTSGDRFIVTGADTFVEGLKQSKSHWFKEEKAPRVNGGGGGLPPKSGKLTPHDVYQAERNWKAGKITREQYDETVVRYDKSR